jgi:hypothetical protein
MCRRGLANLGVFAARARAQRIGAGKLTGAPRVARSRDRHPQVAGFLSCASRACGPSQGTRAIPAIADASESDWRDVVLERA